MKKGIDVSTHNGVIDWETVKTQIDYAIIRCGYGMDQTNQDDKYFKRNVEECIRLSIPFGIYIYSYANTIEKANSEAEHVLRLVDPYKNNMTMGIWYDIEDKIQANLSKNLLKDIITTFCNKIENNGYFVGIYANKNWLENKIDNALKERYVIWIAQYNSKCTYVGKYHMWQYTSDGSVNGINGRVDMNYSYQDRFTVNGQTVVKKPNVQTKPSNDYEVFVGEVQKACGLTGENIDYIAGPVTLKHTITVSSKTNRCHVVVTALERYLKILGYYSGKIEADFGEKPTFGSGMTTAVKNYQKDNGCKIDGEITARNKTWKKLLKLA